MQGLLLTIAIAVAVIGLLTIARKPGEAVPADVSFAAVGVLELALLSAHILTMLYYGAAGNHQVGSEPQV